MRKNRLTSLLFAFLFVFTSSFSGFPIARAEGEITLAIAKSVDKTDVAPGETFTYTLDYAISGTGEVTGAQIVDLLPEGLEYVSSVKTVHITTVDTASVGGRDQVTFRFTTPCATGVSGKLRISARFRNGSTKDGATAINNATFSAEAMSDVVSNNVTVTAHVVAPNWSVSKVQTVPSGQAVGGSPVTYRVRVAGNASGSLNLSDVRVSDLLPAAATFISATGGGTYDSESHKVNWTIASVGVGATADRYVTVTYPEGQTESATNSVTVSAKFYGDDADQPEKTAACTTTFGVAAPGMGSFTKSNRQVQEEYHPGQTSRYGLNGAANTGNVPLDDFMMEDGMPDEINLTSITTGAFNQDLPMSVYYTLDTAAPYNWVKWADTTTVANQTLNVSGLGLPDGARVTRVQWRMGTVPAGFAQSSIINVYGVIRNDAAGVVTNNAWLTSSYRGEALPAKHSSVSFDIVGAYPWLVPAKAIVGGSTRDFGEAVAWTLTVKNHDYATGRLVDPVAIDVLPPNLEYVSYTVNSAPSGVTVGTPVITGKTIGGQACTVVRWPITGFLEPGEAVLITLNTAIADQTPVGWLTNKLYLTTNGAGASAMKGTTAVDTDDLDGDGATDDRLAAAQAQVFVKFQGALTTTAWVKGELDAGWKQYSGTSSYGQTLPGGLANYRFTIKNDGSNGPISNIVAIDTLPRIGDKLIIGSASRGTVWQPYLVDRITGTNGSALPSELKIYYTTNPTPSLAELYDPVNGGNSGDGWSLTPPADITTVTALKFEFNNYTLNPGDALSFEWPMRAPLGAPAGQLAWDSMAVGATCEGESGTEAFLPTESSKVGFIINDHIPYFGVGDHVWLDTNGNGLQDNGEPGVNDILVNLYNSSAPNTVIQYTRTGNDQNGNAGYWAFPSLIADGAHEYIIEYVFPGNYRATAYNADGLAGDSDTNTDSDVPSATLNSGVRTGRITFISPNTPADRLNYDLGIWLPASLSGLVWNDLDHDGVQDTGEGKLAGVTVALTDATGNPVTDADGNAVGSATTAADGSYGFTNLKPGSYKVAVTNPDGANYVFTLANTGGNDSADSDTDASGEVLLSLTSGQNMTHVDSGLHKAILGDKVWLDADADGIQDAGETTGVNNVTVTLKSGGSTVATTKTNASGAYLFQDLNAGNYTVEITVPSGYYLTTMDSGGATDATDSDFDPATASAAVTLSAGQRNNTVDGGLFQPAQVGNLVWNDKNHDGLQTGETGIDGVTVRLTDQSGNPVSNVVGVPVADTITNASGNYTFTNLRPGSYRITVVNPDALNYVFSISNVGANDSIDSDVNSSGIMDFTVASGANNQTLDAGLHKASLGGKVWHDTDADGVQDGGEQGIGSVTVTLKSGGSTVATTTTNASGVYTFQDLNAGDYTVVVTLPSIRYVTSKDASGNDSTDSDFNQPVAGETSTDTVTLAVAANNQTVDCGLFMPATIGDFVWNDQNRNGIQDTGEPGLDGVTVSLLTTAGAAVTDVNGDTLNPVTTSGGGMYSFTNIRPGTYKLHFTLLPEYIFTSAMQGANAAKDSNVVPASGDVGNFVLVSNVTINSYDAGMYKAALGDLVWEDLDADGVQDNGEPGIAGVTVELVKDNGNGIIGAEDTVTETKITDSTGRYAFTELDSGSYFIRMKIPEGYYATARNIGDDAADSDIDTSGVTAIINLTKGQADSSYDAGLFRTASVGDFTWEDMDANGVQDDSEFGIPGVTVRIRDGAGNPVSNVTGDAIDAFTTDISGLYQITGLRPGSYKLQFELPDGYEYTLATGPAATGSDATAPAGWTANFTLASNQANTEIDGGFYRLASLSGVVWKDGNNNGIRDGEETGISGLTVELRNALNVLKATATTGEDGSYSFPGLVPGEYHVVVLQTNPKLFFSPRDQGGDDSIDSDVNASTGAGPSITLVSGQDETNMDAGIQTCADIAVSKTSNKALYKLGETIEFTITATNLGADGATGLALTDVLPTGIDYVSDDGSGSYSQATGIWTVGSLAVGDSATLRITATSSKTGSFTNTAVMSALNEHDGFPANNSGSAAFSVGVSADLQVAKTVNNTTPWLNENVVFTVTVTNNGPDSATNAEMRDLLPAGLTYVSDDAGGSYNNGTGVWAIGTLANGASATIQITAKATALGTITNTATVSAEEYDRNPGNNADNCSIFPKARADLAITKTADVATYSTGDTIAFTLTVENLGPDDATGVAASDLLPDNAAFVSTAGGGGYDSETGDWAIGDLAVGETATLVIRATAGTHGNILNTATVEGNEPDPDETNNSATATVEPATSALGDLVWLDCNGNGIQDEGEAGIPGVTLEVLSASGTAGSTVTDENGNWQFTGLAPGYYQVRVTPPASYILTATESGDDRAIDSNGDQSGTTAAFLLQADTTDTTIDFGLYLPNRISCRVWHDTNRNGLYDGDEAPLPGVTVELYRRSVFWGMTVTDSTGRYSFDGLPAGAYTLKFTPPAGYDFSGGEGVDTDGATGTITLGAGEAASVESGYVTLRGPDTATDDHTVLLAGALALLLGLSLLAAGRKRRTGSKA